MSKYLIIFMLSISLIAGILFFLLYPIAQFPAPTGNYRVGYKKYHWIDQSRKELNTLDTEHQNRELMAHVFYPSSLSHDEIKNKNIMPITPITYDKDAVKSSTEYFAHCSKLPAFLFSSLKFIKTDLQPNAPLAKGVKSFPIIIFSPGAGGPIVQSYTWILEELASHGYVVVGINHPYVSQTVRYPGGHVIKSIYKKMGRDALWKAQQLETNAQDVSFVITKIKQLFEQKDAFWSNVDINKIGMLGHSFGGRTTVRATRKDQRIKCGINLDGGLQDDDAANPFSTPFMFMIAQKSFLWNEDHPEYKKGSDLEPIINFANTSDTNMKVITIQEVGHSIFSDAPLQLNMALFGRLVSRYALFGLEVPSNRATDILKNNIMPKIINFFDENLKYE